MEPEHLATLDELRARLGAPSTATVAAMTPASARERYIARGRQIRSSHIVTDTARLYAYACAYWQDATPEARASLIGVSEELLRLAVDRAVALRDAGVGREGATHEENAAFEARQSEASAAFARGAGLRDQARAALRTVTAPDPALRKALRVAEGTELSGAEALAASLERIAAFATELFARGDEALSTRLALAGLTPAYFATLTAAGVKVRDTARLADVKRSAKKLSQAEIDHLDGLNLELLGHIMAAFEAAHGLDPAVPLLAPIATRRMYVRGNKPQPSDAPEEPDEAAAAEVGGAEVGM